jgi:hypothetical protein
MDKREQKIPGPDHPITVEAAEKRFVVKVGGKVVAHSTATLTLKEAGYPPVQYFPIEDVDGALLRPSPTATYCPYEGDATLLHDLRSRPRHRGCHLDLRRPLSGRERDRWVPRLLPRFGADHFALGAQRGS